MGEVSEDSLEALFLHMTKIEESTIKLERSTRELGLNERMAFRHVVDAMESMSGALDLIVILLRQAGKTGG
jgi:hypothetical protein